MRSLVAHPKFNLKSTLLLTIAGLVIYPASAQQPVGPPPAGTTPKAGDPSIFTLQASARLVLVDVTVQDSQGRPVHGLKLGDFRLEENRLPQRLKSFEEHSAANAGGATPVKMPALPPGSFTNFTPVAKDSTLNVVLLDTLNTPMKDQSYVRQQLQQYVKHSNPNNRIAATCSQ